MTSSDLGEVHSQFLCEHAQALLLNCLEGAGRDAHLDESVAFSPPQPALLQVHLLELLGAHMGVGYGHAVIRPLTGELTDPGHDCTERWIKHIKWLVAQWLGDQANRRAVSAAALQVTVLTEIRSGSGYLSQS